MVLCAVNVFLRVDKMSRSGSDIDDKSYKNCVILAIRVTTCDTLKNKFSRAFPKLPFGCWSGNPVRIKTCRNVSLFLRVLPLVEQGESEFWVDRPGLDVIVFAHNNLEKIERAYFSVLIWLDDHGSTLLAFYSYSELTLLILNS